QMLQRSWPLGRASTISEAATHSPSIRSGYDNSPLPAHREVDRVGCRSLGRGAGHSAAAATTVILFNSSPSKPSHLSRPAPARTDASRIRRITIRRFPPPATRTGTKVLAQDSPSMAHAAAPQSGGMSDLMAPDGRVGELRGV